MTSRRSTSAGGPDCWLLKRDRLRMISRARPLCVLTNAISSSTSAVEVVSRSSSLGGAENRLQRVVQFVGDAGHEHADGGQPFLADDLTLQRLQHFAHLAFLLDLAVEGAARLAQVRRHRDERVLQLRELEVRRRSPARAATGRRRRCAARRAQAVQSAAEQCVDTQSDSAARTAPTAMLIGGSAATAAPSRRRPRCGDADAQQPRPAIDDGVAEEALDAVESARELRRGTSAAPAGARVDRVPMKRSASRLRASTRPRSDQRDHRALRQRELAKTVCRSHEIDAEAQHANDGAPAPAPDSQHDRRLAGDEGRRRAR